MDPLRGDPRFEKIVASLARKQKTKDRKQLSETSKTSLLTNHHVLRAQRYNSAEMQKFRPVLSM
jgi:hypothetical protein